MASWDGNEFEKASESQDSDKQLSQGADGDGGGMETKSKKRNRVEGMFVEVEQTEVDHPSLLSALACDQQPLLRMGVHKALNCGLAGLFEDILVQLRDLGAAEPNWRVRRRLLPFLTDHLACIAVENNLSRPFMRESLLPFIKELLIDVGLHEEDVKWACEEGDYERRVAVLRERRMSRFQTSSYVDAKGILHGGIMRSMISICEELMQAEGTRFLIVRSFNQQDGDDHIIHYSEYVHVNVPAVE